MVSFPVLVGDCNFKALIDTGSCICIMREDVVVSLGLEISSNSMNLRGLGPSTVSALGSVHCSIRIGEISFDCKFLVLSDGAVRHPLILGSNFFQENNMAIDVSQSRLTGSAHWGAFELYLLEDSRVYTIFRKIFVTVVEDTFVPYGSFVLVPVEFPDCVIPDGNSEFYFDGGTTSPYLSGESGILSPCDPISFL